MKRFMFVFILLFTACFKFNNVLPEDKLSTLSVTKIMELAAEQYQANEYKNATYYYNYVIKTFPDDLENVAWAHYEIGFIKYQEGKLQEALAYFKKTIEVKTQNPAPIILALQMTERVERMLKKKGGK